MYQVNLTVVGVSMRAACARQLLFQGGGTPPPSLMTREVYHVERRRGHLSASLAVTASESLESAIGNR